LRASTAAAMLLFCLTDVGAGIPRSAAERAAFKRGHPCPSTGLRSGACPGYVIDHVEPLCAGGPDHRSNFQWQTVAEALEKDRWERDLCRSLRRAKAASNPGHSQQTD
jgi:hypothetical protein